MTTKFSHGDSESLQAVLRHIACWAFAGSLATIMLALVCVHLPNRAKLLLLFPIAYGLFAGCLLGRLAWMTQMHYPRIALVLGSGIVMAGQIVITLESHRLWSVQVKQQYETDPSTILSRQVLAPEALPGDPQQRARSQQILEEFFQQARTERAEKMADIASLSTYLQRRISHLKIKQWPDQWVWLGAGLFWGMEILLAGLAGAFPIRNSARKPYCVACQSWYQPQRSVLVASDHWARTLELLELSATPRSESTDRRAIVQFDCRCQCGSLEVECMWEDAFGRRQHLATVYPSRETFRQLCQLWDSA